MNQDDPAAPTGIKRKQLPTELRAAIWEVHKKRCSYTGDLIAFSDLDIDHVVPITISTGDLARLKREKIIGDDFDLNGLDNLLPTRRFQNGSKSAQVRANSVLIHFLDIAKQHSCAVQERLSVSIDNRRLLTAYLQIKAKADRNSLDVEDVLDIHRQQEGMTRLRHSPELVGGEDITLISADLARTLMVKPFALGGGGIDSVVLQNDAGVETICTNCKEFITAQERGLWARSQFDMNCYGMADRNCGMLSMLEHAKFAPESVLRYPRVTLRNLDRWSSAWVREVWIEFDEVEDGALFNKCKTIADLMAQVTCNVVQQDEWRVAIEPQKGFGLMLSELFRADLDNDGKEEILIFNLMYAPDGTLRVGRIRVAKPDEHGMLQPCVMP
ncbi:hypothetical protein HN018_24155 (plasmid) [Lichenicola cladoniae]|uniref:Uncharacterized protein n=1 Tax=Lichenicola cladoniae TaxID=1484109 RepID=A0A6M8HY78_9PROT|nr:hypothetical protein [Lichenicola cladoniae]NPD70256.1 hypothetical protein [Acetobacteraceae bacterium]QKE93308.1 hypothetical protein HN018_24155 [Lichenicola cladoniae]